jgi:uncharacterized membrane protein YdjX (TVP38/TMEM64 family)
MPRFLRTLLFLALILAVPVVPLLVLGLSFEEQVSNWLAEERSATWNFFLVAGVLASDIFLPVPSSAVSTYAGASGLGIWPATAASWLGMTLGAVIAFALARLMGERMTARFAKESDLGRMAELSRRFGPWAILMTRALPIFAEACVLLMGATQLSWKRFLPPVMIANFAISLVYAAFGVYFANSDALPAAIAASALVPLAVALLARRWLPTRESAEDLSNR